MEELRTVKGEIIALCIWEEFSIAYLHNEKSAQNTSKSRFQTDSPICVEIFAAPSYTVL